MENFFSGHGYTINGMLHLSPREAHELCLKGAVLLDLRLHVLFAGKQFDVPEMLHCHSDEIPEYYHHLPTCRPIIVADAVGIHSREVVEFLTQKGFCMVANLAGGIHDWEVDGLPIIIDSEETLSGGCTCQIRTWGKKLKGKK